MTRQLIIHSAGPGMTVQDQGRTGYLAFGLSRGGAADRLALDEAAALLDQPSTNAAIEMAGMGGTFETTTPTRIALTGAPMRTSLDGQRLAWNASHTMHPGQLLTIAAATKGVYGYLSFGGGVNTAKHLGSRSSHLAGGIGTPLQSGNRLPIGSDTSTLTGQTLPDDPRFDGGTIRIVPSLQTDVFDPAETSRFTQTRFTRDTRGNRMGVRLLPDGAGFHTESGLNILSEVIVPGDIQITGDGTPFVLLSECQTTGGYPRIGSVLPSDLPKVAQARPGTQLSFTFVSLPDAIHIEQNAANHRAALKNKTRPLIRDPHLIQDLLSYQLIDGAVTGTEPGT